MGRPPKAVPKQQVPVKHAFQRELLGDLIFDTEKDHHRGFPFLQRNIKRILRYHKRCLIKAGTSKLKKDALANGSSFSQNTGPSLSFGENNSQASFSDARKAAAEPDDICELQAFSEYIENPLVSLHVATFDSRPEPLKNKLELQLDVINLRARSVSAKRASPKSRRSQSCNCTVSLLPFNHDGAPLDQVLKGRSDCTLIIDPSTQNIKVNLKQPFKFDSGHLTCSRYHVGIRLSPIEGLTTEWPPLPLTRSKARSTLVGEGRNGRVRDGLHAIYEDFLQPTRTRQRARVLYAAQGAVFETEYSLEISIARVVAAPPRLGNGLMALEGAGVITSYTITPSHDHEFPAGIRQVKFEGLRCVLCLRPLAQIDFEDVLALRFHFATSHPAHMVVLQGSKTSTLGRLSMEHSFLVSAAPQKEKFAARLMSWVVPRVPFDAAAYIDGDESWLGNTSMTGRKAPVTASQNRVEEIRRRNHGFLPVNLIQDKSVRVRKKYPVPTTKTRTPFALFTSITHRVLQPDEELSESDDEIDQTWLRDKHAQEIMDETQEPLELRRLQVRWNDHVKSESLSSAFYCSDVFFRWVKKDKEWLAGNEERLNYYHQFSKRLWEEGKVSTGVVRKCRAMIYLKAPTEKTTDAAVALADVDGT
jgi:hypothetical protein